VLRDNMPKEVGKTERSEEGAQKSATRECYKYVWCSTSMAGSRFAGPSTWRPVEPRPPRRRSRTTLSLRPASTWTDLW